MSHTLSTVTPKLFRNYSSPIVFETSSDDFLGAWHGAIGISASYQCNCRLGAVTFSSPSKALVVHLTNGDIPLGSINRNKRHKIIRGRSLLQKHILCNANYQKYSFEMDRIAIASYLDMALCINGAVDMLSVSLSDRRSLQALMKATGSELTLHQPNVKALFFNNESPSVSDSNPAQQVWATCQVAILPHMITRFRALERIRTETIPDEPLIVKNDIKPDITVKINNLTLTSQWLFQIETWRGVQVSGRVIRIEGREARIQILGSLQGDKIKQTSRVQGLIVRASSFFAILKGGSTLLLDPFFKVIWLPNEPSCWPPSDHLQPKIPIYSPNPDLKVNTSQESAIEKILSTSDEDRVVLIQGPPGTGKTRVVTVAITSIVSFPAASSRTAWTAAQSNVAAKNIAEKFDKIGFYQFALLVSKEFHFDWHEHFYKKLEPRLIRSDAFSDGVVSADRQLRGGLGEPDRNRKLPSVSRRFTHTLTKIVFIGDPKQLPPYGQEDIPTLQSIFGVEHLRKKHYSRIFIAHHENSISFPCHFVHVRGGREQQQLEKSWINRSEARVVVRIARAYQTKGVGFRISTPHDDQHALSEHEFDWKRQELHHEDSVFNVDSFQGNEAEHIIISADRTDRLGFLANH
ncbi:P-loop containing nucleoside triphosphate hydrolase protein [Pisolithus tinctorius]|nr:P-loop containing nucleoside triphosphate hydrolase protein [Pisolithus tinctorius]